VQYFHESQSILDEVSLFLNCWQFAGVYLSSEIVQEL